MHYLLLLTAAPEAWATNTPADDGVIDDWAAYTRALSAAGVLVGGQGLHGDDTATTIQVRNGTVNVTDGPYVEAKEHLIGFYLIEVADLDEAISWGAKAPSARIGSVEVRPVLAGSSTDETLRRGDSG